MMLRKSLLLALVLVILVPALTGWAGDRCCPPDESRCGAACGESHSDPGGDRDHGNTDPGHQQALCGCACHALFSAAAGQAPLDVPGLLGRLEPHSILTRSKAHLSDIFHPPLA